MVMALCHLHNFCTDQNCSNEVPLETDTIFTLDMNATATNDFEPPGLLHGGDHLEDVGRNLLRQHQRAVAANTQLPQQRLHDLIVNQGLRHPTLRQW